MLRAANTGVSAVIDVHGRVLDNLGLDRAGVLVAPVPGALPPTLAGRMGLWMPALLGVLTAALGSAFRYGHVTAFKKRDRTSEKRKLG